MLQEFGIYAAIGIVAGTFAGLLGIGGGLVVVPALLFAFTSQGFTETLAMHLAIGTSLASICATSLASMHAHHTHKAVLWHHVATMIPGAFVGAIAGAMLAGLLPGAILRNIFGIFVFIAAAQIGFGSNPPAHRTFPGSLGANIASTIIGLISAFLGIGGGSMTVPFFMWCNIPVRQAVATAAAIGLPLAVSGTIGAAISGWGRMDSPPYASGFIYWPAFIGIILTSTIFAGLGAKLAHRLPTMLLRRIFAIFLCVIGTRLLWK